MRRLTCLLLTTALFTMPVLVTGCGPDASPAPNGANHDHDEHDHADHDHDEHDHE